MSLNKQELQNLRHLLQPIISKVRVIEDFYFHNYGSGWGAKSL